MALLGLEALSGTKCLGFICVPKVVGSENSLTVHVTLNSPAVPTATAYLVVNQEGSHLDSFPTRYPYVLIHNVRI